jgi:hypothetical protein
VHETAIHLDWFAEYNHLAAFSAKGRTAFAFAKVVLISILLDEAANLVCQQQIAMLGFPAQFDLIFRVTHNSLKRRQLAVLAPFAALRRFDQP